MAFDEMILNTLLQQSQNASDKLDTISKTMVNIVDFRRYQDALDDKFVEITETLEDHTDKFTAQDKLNINHESRLMAAQSFIQNLSSGFRWLMRALIVAGLSLSASIFLSFYNGNVARQNATPISIQTLSPLNVPTPSHSR
jgi:predicted PurR-regulated permease PerM